MSLAVATILCLAAGCAWDAAAGTTANDAFATAQQLASAGNCAAAVRYYGLAVSRDRHFIDAYFALAQCQTQDGDYGGARQTYTTALRVDGNDYQLYYRRGVVEAMEGDNVSAWQDERDALRLAPPAISAYVPISEAFSNSGDYADAIVAVDHALNLEKRSDLFIMRGDNYRLEELYDAAVRDYKAALAVAENNGSRAEALAAAARMYQQMQQYDDASFAAQRAISLDPRNNDYYNLAASIANASGHLTEAEALYHQVIKENTDPDALRQFELSLAALYAQENKMHAALSTYGQALRHARDRATEAQIYLAEGDLYAKMERKPEALLMYNRAKDADRGTAFRQSVNARIDALGLPARQNKT